MSFYQLDFEREITELEDRIRLAEGRAEPTGGVPALGGIEAGATSGQNEPDDPALLREQRDRRLAELYEELDSWDTVRVARHPDRPQTRDYVRLMCRDFAELHGDRRFGDDPAIVTGFARLGAHKVLIVGHQKGKDTQEKLACHFGCAHPEGYRKALAKMKLAEKYGLPIVTLVDTPGAFPGLGAEERGQAEAIAVNLREMSRLRVPVVSVIIGEGGSGGALGIAVANRVGMLEFAWYSVISPEGCAAILWKQANDQTTRDAAEALRLTARDNLDLGVIDEIIHESLGGAHRDPERTAQNLGGWIVAQLDELSNVSPDEFIASRYERFRSLGQISEQQPTQANTGHHSEDERVSPST